MVFSEGDGRGVIGSALIQLISILTFYGAQLGVKELYPSDYGTALRGGEIFDVVIVGGGTAGCVLANRLSEIKDWKVLVLEAGTVPSIDVEVPLFNSRILNTKEDWIFKTEKEENLCRGTPDKTCYMHSGKMLGGSTGLSNMHYERANEKYFHDWDIISLGNATMHYENVESYQDNNKNTNFGISGEIPIHNLKINHPANDLIFASAKLSGYQQITNTDEPQLGYYFVNGYIHEGERWNFAKAFFKKAKDRDNLYVAQNALVSRIVTNEPVDSRVSGVDVIINGNEFFIKSKREVIVTCGAINTAKLLMLSGIGPADQIKKFRIIVNKDLPAIGKHYKDQIGVPLFISLVGQNLQKRTDFGDATYNFLKNKTGPFTRITLNNIIGYINTNALPLIEPNVKIHHYFFEPCDHNFRRLVSNYGYISQITETIFRRNKNAAVLIIMPILINPISKGEIILKSTNPYTPPIIKGNYLSDPTLNDLETLVSSLRYVQNLTSSQPFVKNGAEIIYPDIPECRNYKNCTDQYWRCYVKNLGIPMSQGVGTVKSGKNFADCEVSSDEYFLVKGIRHLRVVDGSVLSNCVPGSLEATVAMLADKVASDIRETWS